MVFEPNFTKVVSSTRRNIGTSQVAIEVKLPTQEISIENIYSVGARSTILSYEAVGNNINFVGLVDFQAMYRAEMGVAAIDYSAEFKDRFTSEDEVNGELILSSNVVDVTSQVTTNGIKVVAIVEVVIDEIASKDINVLTKVGGEDVYQSTKQVEFAAYIGRAYEKFDITEEISIKHAKNILMVTPCATLNKVEPRENYLVLQGVLGVDICYENGENLEDIASEYRSFDFSWEVALNGINEDSLVQSALSLLSNEIKVSSTPDEEGVLVNMYVPLVYNGYVFAKNSLEVVDDVYLENNYLSVTTENFDTIVGSGDIHFSDNISGTASILDTAPFIDEILGVCTNNIVLARTLIQDDRLDVEGVANATVVYYTKETNELTSVQVEIPFSVEQKVSGQNASVVTICLNQVSARSKRGKEIEVSATLSVYADLYSSDSMSVISDITLGQEKPVDDCALFIYIVKPGQSLWDIAKELGVSSDLILEQNPELELPVKAGDKLVVYRPRIMHF